MDKLSKKTFFNGSKLFILSSEAWGGVGCMNLRGGLEETLRESLDET